MTLPHDFGVVLADPPWAYEKTSRHEKLRGYSDTHYAPLDTKALRELPVSKYTADSAVLLLWTTWPFIGDALQVVDAWGFEYVTGLPWVKVTSRDDTKPVYGVGYWMRGATEVILIGKKHGGRSARTPFIGLVEEGFTDPLSGLVTESFQHSRKPDDVYMLAEAFGAQVAPGKPRLELFARRLRDGWVSLGNEAPGDGIDIRERLT